MIEYALAGAATVDGSAYDPLTTEQYHFMEGRGSDERRSTGGRHCLTGRHRLIEQYRTVITWEVGA